MKLKQLVLLGLSLAMMASCVSSKKYKKVEKNYTQLDSIYRALQADYSKCREKRSADEATIQSMQAQLAETKSSSNQIMDQMKDLSVITGTQAESIKKSLENIGVKDAYIKDLQACINRKDSLNMALVINLKSAIGNLSDNDINIKVDKSVVYVDISDKLLFASGKYNVSEPAKVVLGKVAKVLEAQPSIEFLVEGHTDDVPFKEGLLLDNWDLSVKRATAVVRILQDQYHIAPARMTAAGRAEFVPAIEGDSKEAKAANRRTRIVILPQMDQFFKLLEKPNN